MSAEVRELAVHYGAAWAEHDLDAIMAMHTDDTVFHLHGAASLLLVEPQRGRCSQLAWRSSRISALSGALSTSARITL
jgi:hypothetical protein